MKYELYNENASFLKKLVFQRGFNVTQSINAIIENIQVMRHL